MKNSGWTWETKRKNKQGKVSKKGESKKWRGKGRTCVSEWNYSWPESCVWFSILGQGFLWLVGRLDLEALGARSSPLTPLKKRQRNKHKSRERERKSAGTETCSHTNSISHWVQTSKHSAHTYTHLHTLTRVLVSPRPSRHGPSHCCCRVDGFSCASGTVP